MRLYKFSYNDQRHANWLIHQDKATGLGFEPTPEYTSFVCPKCRKFSHDAVFEYGFPDFYRLKLRGDIAVTLDGFLCINDKALQLIESNRFPGLRYKQVDNRGWYVVNIFMRFDVAPGTYQVVRGTCEECKRNREVILGLRHLGQLIHTPQQECIFSTVQDWECSRLDDRSMFFTEGVLECFRQNRIKGGLARLIHSVEEETRMQTELKSQGKCKWPKGSTVVL